MALDLFGKKSQPAAEEELIKKWSVAPIIDVLVDFVRNNSELWTSERQSYYDSGLRFVEITPRMLIISRHVLQAEEQESFLEGSQQPSNGTKLYSYFVYTKNGYKPLHDYISNAQNVVPCDRVRQLLATVILDRLKAEMPHLKFNEACEGLFSYTLPELTFNDWF